MKTMTFRRLAAMGLICAALGALTLKAKDNKNKDDQKNAYAETDLVSDQAGMAAATDANLVNPWGLAASAKGPWWVSDNGTGLSTLYNGAGAVQSLVVTVPGAANATGPSAPTGMALNGSATDFLVGPNAPAHFLFVTEDGTVSGWNSGKQAVRMVDNSGAQASYKGVALGQLNGGAVLYAANFTAGTVDVFDSAFKPVTLAAGAFQDPEVPAVFHPFNIEAIGNLLYVTFARSQPGSIDELHGPGQGHVAAFTMDGRLDHRLQWGAWLNAPWAVVQAPASGFGRFSGDLLVGQFGSGKIVAFDPASGEFRGVLRGTDHHAVRIDGLWGLRFGNDASAGPSTSLYFTAGVDDEAHGLFGTLTAAP